MLPSFYDKNKIEAGCDEAGRGCLAGAVFAAAVILPPNFQHPFLNDSKQLNEKQRITLRPIIEKEALAWAVASVSPSQIDKINILKASFLAMHLAIEQLNLTPELLLIDGNRFTPYPTIEHICFIKGDARFASIAAASVLAKTHRDEYMERLHQEYPAYLWNNNKGYPSVAHREAIRANGITEYHRRSFQLLPEATLFD